MLNEFRLRLGFGGGRADLEEGETQPLLDPAQLQPQDPNTKTQPSPKTLLATWLCLVAFITNGLLDGVMYGLAVFTEKLAQTYNCSTGIIKGIGYFQVGASAFLTVPAKYLVNKLGANRVCCLGAFSAAFGSLLSAFSQYLAPPGTLWDLVILVTGQIVFIGGGFAFMYMSAMMALTSRLGGHTPVQGFAVSGSAAGQVLVTPSLSILLEAQGLQTTYLVQALVCTLVGLVGYWILDETKEGEAEAVDALSDRATKKVSNFKASTTVKALFILGDFWGVWALYNLYSPTAKDALLKGAGSPGSEFGNLVLTLGFCSWVGRVATSILLHKKWVKGHVATIAGLLGAGVCTVVMAIATSHNQSSVTLLRCCWGPVGLFSGMWIVSTSPLLTDLYGEDDLAGAFMAQTIARGIAHMCPLISEAASPLMFPLFPVFLSGGMFILGVIIDSSASHMLAQEMLRYEAPKEEVEAMEEDIQELTDVGEDGRHQLGEGGLGEQEQIQGDEEQNQGEQEEND